MRSLLLFALSIPPTMSCCVEADAVELDETTSELGIGPTVLTLYESSNATGKSLSIDLSSPDDFERIRLVSKPDVTAAGLLGKVSAVRLKCGTRDARVVLFNDYNASNTSFSSWSHLGGDGATINCVSGQTKTINLHTTFPALADDVASAFLVTHARQADNIPFTDYFESAWAVALDKLPSAAKPTQTTIWLSTTRQFHVRQFLTIDSWACTKRGAVFEYSVQLHDNATFTASVVDSYVDFGFGDAWGCRDKMQSALDASIAGSKDDLETGLGDLVHFLAPGHARYYFAPDVHLASFDLFFGADQIVNAPGSL